METKHTKGDWRSVTTSNDQGLIIDDTTGDNIAVSYYKDDAPLIAAAPDLLDNLAKIVDAAQMSFDARTRGDAQMADVHFNAIMHWMDAARAAIAKAMG